MPEVADPVAQIVHGDEEDIRLLRIRGASVHRDEEKDDCEKGEGTWFHGRECADVIAAKGLIRTEGRGQTPGTRPIGDRYDAIGTSPDFCALRANLQRALDLARDVCILSPFIFKKEHPCPTRPAPFPLAKK